MWRDEATLLDIPEAGRRIARFVKGVELAECLADTEKQWAMVAQLLIMGEAVRRLSTEFTAAHADVAWAKMVGMRNRLIHGYETINLETVWRTATEPIPQLMGQLEVLAVPTDTELGSPNE